MYGGVGLGTFPLAGPFSPVSPDDATAILDAYFAAGGRYLDTAPTYAFGGVEELLGRYLSGLSRDSFVVSTSCGYVRDGDAYRVSGRRDDVLRDAEESLSRLKIDHFDIYISHIPDPETPLEETSAALQELKDDGIANRIGVSNVNSAQLARYRTAGDISIVQNRFSFVNQAMTDALRDELVTAGADMVAYQVIERGLLSGMEKKQRSDADLRNRKPEFEQSRVDWLDENLVGPLSALAEREESTVASLAVGWTLAQPAVSVVQIGATSAGQAALIPTLGQNLAPQQIAEMDQIRLEAARQLPPGWPSIEAFMGIADYDVRSGSASGS